MADVLRISIKGTLPAGEEWSVNPVYRIGGDFGSPVSSTQCNTIAQAIAALALPTGLQGLMTSSCAWTGVRVEARSLAGNLESQGEALRPLPAAGNGNDPNPFQSSLVISLRTPLGGASGRGRIYWPATGVQLNTATLRPSAAVVTSALSGAKTLLSGIQTAIDTTLDGISLVVWSRKLLSTSNVNQLQMGDIVDSQRRRRDQMVETYQSLTYP